MRLLFLLAIAAPLLAQWSPADEAKHLAEQGREKALQFGQVSSLTGLVPEGSPSFDPEAAQTAVLGGLVQPTETTSFIQDDRVAANERENRGFGEDDLLFSITEGILFEPPADSSNDTPNQLEETRYCLVADGPKEIRVVRSLEVEVTHHPEVVIESRRCEGHRESEYHGKKKKAKAAKKRISDRLAADPEIKDYKVDIHSHGPLHDYEVAYRWTHSEDARGCDSCRLEREVIQEEEWEEEDTWSSDRPEIEELALGPDCTLVNRTCLVGDSERMIEGRLISRPCWKEELVYHLRDPGTQTDCPWKYSPFCEFIRRECVEDGPAGCSLWRLEFRCITPLGLPGVPTSQSDAPIASASGSDSFPEVVAKLAIFKDMKSQLVNANASDPRNISFFGGEVFTCAKSVAEDVMYDCCFDFGGLAKDLKLTDCNSEELALRDKRKRGFCYHIGHYSEKFLDLWKSREVNVFCCFPSKLARVFQEASRPQLAMNWGTPEHPLCGGLSQEQIANLNFSELDLSKAYDDSMERSQSDSTTVNQKLQAFQDRVQERLGEGSDA